MSLRTAPEPRRKKPVWQRRERDFIRRTPLSPTVRFSRWMDGGRHDDHTAIASKIEPGGKAGSVFYLESGVLEVDVAASTAGGRFDRFGRPGILQRKPHQQLFPAVARVDIEDDDAGNRTRHDGYVGQRPTFEPAAHLGLGRMSLLEGLPTHDGPLAALDHWHDRPAAGEIAQRGS